METYKQEVHDDGFGDLTGTQNVANKFYNNVVSMRGNEPIDLAAKKLELESKLVEVDVAAVDDAEMQTINRRLIENQERASKAAARLRTAKDAIEELEKKIAALDADSKKLQGDEAALKDTRNQLIDARNKDLKACCDKQKTFDKAKKLLVTKYRSGSAVRGILDSIFRFVHGPDSSYDPEARLMRSLDDFNTGVRSASSNTLDKDTVSQLMDKVRGGENSRAEWYNSLIADETDKDSAVFIPFFKLLSRQCHLAMHMYKFDKCKKKLSENSKKVSEHQTEIARQQAVVETLQFAAHVEGEIARTRSNELAYWESKTVNANARQQLVEQKKAVLTQRLG